MLRFAHFIAILSFSTAFHDDIVENFQCLPCGNTFYCTQNGRFPCPLNSTTKFTTVPSVVEDCICNPGFLRVNDSCPTGLPPAYYFEGVQYECPSLTETRSPLSSKVTDCGCIEGYHYTDSQQHCAICQPNTYSYWNFSQCPQCPDFSFHNLIGSGNITDCKCVIGYEGRDGGPCSACKGGFYKNITGSTPCPQCERAEYSDGTASTVCKSCHAHTDTPYPATFVSDCLCIPGFEPGPPAETPTQFATTGQDVHAESGRSILLTDLPIQLSVGEPVVVDWSATSFHPFGLSLNNTLFLTPGPDIVTQDIDYTAMTTSITLNSPSSPLFYLCNIPSHNFYGVAVEVVSNEPYCTQCPAGKFKNVTENSPCSFCAPGKFQSQVGMTVCEDCTPDSQSVPDFTSCICNPGFRDPNFPWPYPEMCGDTVAGYVLTHDQYNFYDQNQGNVVLQFQGVDFKVIQVFYGRTTQYCSDNPGAPCDEENIDPYRHGLYADSADINLIRDCSQACTDSTDKCYGFTVSSPAGYAKCFIILLNDPMSIHMLNSAGDGVSNDGWISKTDSYTYIPCQMPEHTCVSCDAGTYKPLPGDGACTDCPSEQHTTAYASTAISDCFCIQGYFGDFYDCQPCAPGTYKNFTSTDQHEECIDCPFATHSPEASVERTECLCNAGYTGPDGKPCSACLVGTYKVINGSSACLDCHTDSFQNKSAQTFCHDCIAWSSTFNRTAQTHITNCTCIPGSFREGLVLEPICRPCDPGFYAAETQCEFCSNMSYTTEYGSLACIPCIETSVSSPNRTECLCIKGHSCRMNEVIMPVCDAMLAARKVHSRYMTETRDDLAKINLISTCGSDYDHDCEFTAHHGPSWCPYGVCALIGDCAWRYCEEGSTQRACPGTWDSHGLSSNLQSWCESNPSVRCFDPPQIIGHVSVCESGTRQYNRPYMVRRYDRRWNPLTHSYENGYQWIRFNFGRRVYISTIVVEPHHGVMGDYRDIKYWSFFDIMLSNVDSVLPPTHSDAEYVISSTDSQTHFDVGLLFVQYAWIQWNPVYIDGVEYLDSVVIEHEGLKFLSPCDGVKCIDGDCTDCPLHSYKDTVSSVPCSNCKPSSITVERGSIPESECRCIPGYIETDADICAKCDPNQYSTDYDVHGLDAQACVTCPNYTVTNGVEPWDQPDDCKDCTLCPANDYWLEGCRHPDFNDPVDNTDAVCELCPPDLSIAPNATKDNIFQSLKPGVDSCLCLPGAYFNYLTFVPGVTDRYTNFARLCGEDGLSSCPVKGTMYEWTNVNRYWQASTLAEESTSSSINNNDVHAYKYVGMDSGSQYVQIDMGQIKGVTEWKLWTYTYDAASVCGTSFHLSNDTITWVNLDDLDETLSNIPGPCAGNTQCSSLGGEVDSPENTALQPETSQCVFTFAFKKEIFTRHIRISGVKNNNQFYRWYEWKIFGWLQRLPACDYCPQGTYKDEMGRRTCDVCPPTTDTLLCSDDPAHCDDIDDCFCVPGMFFDGTQCTFCDIGTFKPSIANSPCVPCPSLENTWNHNGTILITGGLQCFCDHGFTRSQPTGSDTPGCEPCTPGQFKAYAGDQACGICPVDTFTRHNASLECTPCPANMSTFEANEQARCHCPPGFEYSDTTPAYLACQDCVVGKFKTDPFDPTCHNCTRLCDPSRRILTRCNAVFDLVCQTCQPNSNMPIANHLDYCHCNAGYQFVTDPDTNIGSCDACPIGTARATDSNNSIPCKTCIHGSTYAANTAQAQCDDCSLDCGRTPENTFTEYVTEECKTTANIVCTTCQLCPAGQYELFPCGGTPDDNDRNDTVCAICPPGFYCPGGLQRSPIQCPEHSNSEPGVDEIFDCICNTGYFEFCQTQPHNFPIYAQCSDVHKEMANNFCGGPEPAFEHPLRLRGDVTSGYFAPYEFSVNLNWIETIWEREPRLGGKTISGHEVHCWDNMTNIPCVLTYLNHRGDYRYRVHGNTWHGGQSAIYESPYDKAFLIYLWVTDGSSGIIERKRFVFQAETLGTLYNGWILHDYVTSDTLASYTWTSGIYTQGLWSYYHVWDEDPLDCDLCFKCSTEYLLAKSTCQFVGTNGCVPNQPVKVCQKCDYGLVCIGGEITQCPVNSFTLSASSSGIRDCHCHRGFYRVWNADNTFFTCEPCLPGDWCFNNTANNCTDDRMHTSPPSFSPLNCTCHDGWYNDDSNTVCLACPRDSYCVDGIRYNCTVDRWTQNNLNSDNATDCKCRPGLRQVGDTCVVCEEDTFCVGDNTQDFCPGNSTSPAGSTHLGDCLCELGYEPRNGQISLGCARCPDTHYKDTISNTACQVCRECVEGLTYALQVCTRETNTQCHPCTVCETGITFEKTACTLRIDATCQNCTVCNWELEYEMIACSALDDAVCDNITFSSDACQIGEYRGRHTRYHQSDCYACQSRQIPYFGARLDSYVSRGNIYDDPYSCDIECLGSSKMRSVSNSSLGCETCEVGNVLYKQIDQFDPNHPDECHFSCRPRFELVNDDCLLPSLHQKNYLHIEITNIELEVDEFYKITLQHSNFSRFGVFVGPHEPRCDPFSPSRDSCCWNDLWRVSALSQMGQFAESSDCSMTTPVLETEMLSPTQLSFSIQYNDLSDIGVCRLPEKGENATRVCEITISIIDIPKLKWASRRLQINLNQGRTLLIVPPSLVYIPLDYVSFEIVPLYREASSIVYAIMLNLQSSLYQGPVSVHMRVRGMNYLTPDSAFIQTLSRMHCRRFSTAADSNRTREFVMHPNVGVSTISYWSGPSVAARTALVQPFLTLNHKTSLEAMDVAASHNVTITPDVFACQKIKKPRTIAAAVVYSAFGLGSSQIFKMQQLHKSIEPISRVSLGPHYGNLQSLYTMLGVSATRFSTTISAKQIMLAYTTNQTWFEDKFQNIQITTNSSSPILDFTPQFRQQCLQNYKKCAYEYALVNPNTNTFHVVDCSESGKNAAKAWLYSSFRIFHDHGHVETLCNKIDTDFDPALQKYAVLLHTQQYFHARSKQWAHKSDSVYTYLWAQFVTG